MIMSLNLKGTRLGVVASVVIAMGLAASLLGPAQAANAADHDLQFSTDGISYGPTIAGPLFGASAIVPGGVRHATLYVKNGTSHDAMLDLHIMNTTTSAALFVESLTLQGEAGGVTGTPVDLGTASDCALLLSGTPLSAGRSVKVALTLAMMSSVTDAVAQRESAALNLRMSLTDAGAPTTVDTGCLDGTDLPVFAAGPSEPTKLAATGVDPQLPLIFGGLLLGIGIALLLARRKREREE
jgi:LPXTG-motif cell wall-anchored protein